MNDTQLLNYFLKNDETKEIAYKLLHAIFLERIKIKPGYDGEDTIRELT